MSIESRRPGCLDEETLAAFADGRLKRSEMPAVLEHLRTCPMCMSALEVANEIVGAKEARPFRWWWAGAAAAVIAAVLVTVPLLRREESPMTRVVKLAPADARPVETRLTAFAWAPYRGPMRAGDPAEDARRLQLAGAAGDAVARANADPSAKAQWEAGVALLLVGEHENALRRLRAAGERASKDAAIWSDLAAALDASAIRLERKSLHADALAAADRALAADAAHPQALFNRALILEHLGLAGEARKAWGRYLAADPSSPWANEAREHLRRLPVSTGNARFRAEQSDLRKAAELVPAFPQYSRAYAEGTYLGRWGTSGDVAALDAARAIGDALRKLSGESLLQESVRVIDAAGGSDRARLAAAHALYDGGRIELSRQEPVSAERDLRRAAAMFEEAGSPMAYLARYFAACARFEGGDVEGARRELEEQLASSHVHPGYAALRAQIGWQLATAAMSDLDWAGALERLNDSEGLFRRLGERSNLGFIRSMQSTAMSCLGRPDEAWAARIEAFQALEAEGFADRLPVALGGAARMELHAGRLESARAFLRLEVEAVRDTKNQALLANALVRETLLQMQLGDRAAAVRAAGEAMRAATSLSGAAREIAVADANLAAGAAALHGDRDAARRALSEAIDSYRASKRAVFLPQAYLLRARAELLEDDRDSALRDLGEGMDVLERHRLRLAGPLAGADILDAGVALGREAIRLRLEKGDVAGAFREVERRNLRAGGAGESPVTLDVLQRHLAGTDAAVMMLAMQPAEAVAITITETKIATARAPLDEQTLDSRIRGAAAGRLADAEALYDALLRPSEQTLSAARRLIVVADPLLREVPYAALYDRVTRRHLIEQMPVAVAESASSLEWESAANRPQSILAVLLPAGGSAVLPDAMQEVSALQTLYPRFVALTGARATFREVIAAAQHADVVHIAGHTARPRGSVATALLFASGETVSWNDVASAHFTRAPPLVVLAACETLDDPDPRHARALSLGGGFLAAGAGGVIGTLAPIPDRDAQELFDALHRHLAAGLPAADALRQAQLDALRMESTTRRTAWRAIALLTRHVA